MKICAAGTRGKVRVCDLAGIPQSEERFYKDAQKRDGLTSYCKECVDRMVAERIAALDPLLLQERRRAAQFRYQYGLEPNEYTALVSGGCQICGSFDRICVDHDHETGAIRGALCEWCNMGLGRFKDDSTLLEKAIEYLTCSGNSRFTRILPRDPIL